MPIKQFNFTEKDGFGWTYTYDTLTLAERTATDPYGKVTSSYYNANGTLRAKTVPFNGSVKLTSFYTYDSNGNLLTETDPVDISTYTPAIDPQTVDIASLASRTPPIKTVMSYTLPWNFSFYGQSYSQVTVDTNGNIWFGATTAANSFSLPAAGRGPVSAAWNDDLSSVYDGGVFIQHKTNPERVVLEWRTETYTDEGNDRPNSFEIVLFQNGNIRFDYQSFAAANAKDFGSGISKDDTTHYLSVTANYANTFTLAGRSFSFTPAGSGTVLVTVDFIGTGQGSVTSTPPGIACNTDCSDPFTSGNEVTLHPQALSYSYFGGWNGAGCSGTGDCIFTPNVDTTVTATFTYDVTQQVLVDNGTQTYYSALQSAFDAATDGATIRLWATTYNESLTCGRPVTVTLQGGYNSGYTAIVGDPVLNGALTITDGTLVLDGFSVQ